MITHQATFEDTQGGCPHCGERIGVAEQVVRVPLAGESELRVWHYECFQRTLIGSVAHQMKACRCFVAYATCGDEPALTRRQAARAATGYWLRQRTDETRRAMEPTPPACDRAAQTEYLACVLRIVCQFYPNSFQL